MADAGKGIKIGMIDTGIDIAHPAFQGFTTPIPSGYPILSDKTELVNTNNKVIVARNYLSSLSSVDQDGHGTGTSMAAAGLTNDLSLVGIQGIPPITGAAPAAWLGNYNVFDDNGGTDSATFLLALQDALNDGMNVVNYSVGGPALDANANTGPEGRAINAALAAGMIVVAAAGNGASFINLDSGFEERYPGGGTITDPAILPAVIAAGSNLNDRYLGFAVAVDGAAPYPALVPDAESGDSGQITGVLVDVTSVGGDSLGCSAYPANSLQGMVAVIQRGTCLFDDKLNNAMNAGAVAAVVYDNKVEDLFSMSITATLPATMISQANGQDLVARIKANPTLKGLVDFNGTYPLPQPSDDVSIFSSSGPTTGGGIKPDLMATGEPVVTATAGGGYVLEAGTSFSAPLVTGSIAVLMSARPGLTAAQYTSLVTNSAATMKPPDGTVLTPQTIGGGKLDLFAALNNSLVAVPASVTFNTAAAGGATSSADFSGRDAGSKNLTRSVAITNVGSVGDTFAVALNPINTDGTVPVADTTTFSLKPGDSKTVNLTLTDGGLASGEYHGYITITGSKGGPVTRIPYWYGVAGASAKYITLIAPGDGESCGGGGCPTGTLVTFCTRYVDQVRLPIAGDPPTVTSTASRARVVAVTPGSTADQCPSNIPGTYQLDLVVGRADSQFLNVFTVTGSGVTRTITIFHD
jgi:subtilisin family serine protease